MAAIPLIRRSALHAFHLAEASMIEDHGWQCADSYGSVDAEVQAIREQVGLSDISPQAKLDIQGNDVFTSLGQKLSLETGPVGRAVRVPSQSLQLDTQTGGLLCSLTKNHARLISPPGTASAVHTRVESVIQQITDSACIHLTDVTSNFTAVQIVGPHSRDLLRKLTALDLRPAQFPDLSCAQGSLASIHALVLRADIQAHLAYQVYCGREFGAHVWDALLDAGQEFGALPFGLAAQHQLHAQG